MARLVAETRVAIVLVPEEAARLQEAACYAHQGTITGAMLA